MGAITLRQVQEDPNRKDLFGVLNNYIQPDSATSVSQATASFTKAISTPDEGFFWGFWRDIFNVAEQIPHDNAAQDKLAAFIRELTLVPNTGDKIWEESRVWIDLPLLGASVREHLDQVAQGDARVSFHAFLARLYHTGVSPGTETTAIWLLRDALEQDVNPANNASKFDNDLAVAAVYIEYAGATFVQKLALQPEPVLTDESRRVLRGGKLWTEGSGLTVGRWKFWGRRLGELVESAAGEEAKALALHAARLIEVWSDKQLST
ncbi:hypothetical protein EKO27_g3445 [Xylaria grammica]|uniref:Uncharacterized protein n=1 Tax=Xylaria grammica TaxID=363999 RepID=A0A439DB65_9PEZI|nr:hypothetical protein EKO27_g3445 [Xylaria grammica]